MGQDDLAGQGTGLLAVLLFRTGIGYGDKGIAVVCFPVVVWIVKCFCKGYENRNAIPFVIWKTE